MPMTLNWPFGVAEPQIGPSLSMNMLSVAPLASVIVTVVLAPQLAGQVPPFRVTLLIWISRLSSSSRNVLKSIVESRTALQVLILGTTRPKLPVENRVTIEAFEISV